MKTFILIILLAFTLIQNSKAQNDSAVGKKFFLLFSIGGAKALGDLADQNIQNENAGLVVSGFDTRLAFGYKCHEKFGVLVISDVQNFTINAQGIADYLAKENPGLGFKVESNTGWGLQTFFIGTYGNFPITKNKTLIFEPRVMIGSALSKSPHLKITGFIVSNGVTQSITQEQLSTSSTKFGFAYLVGAGLKYNFAKRMSAVFNVDYLGLSKQQQYSNVIIKYDGGATETTSFKMSYKSITTTVGIGFRFGKK